MLGNRDIVPLGADLRLAPPLGGHWGTLHCWELVRKTGITVRVYEGRHGFRPQGPVFVAAASKMPGYSYSDAS